ncbi:MAG TPA: hypothetical protein ENF73_05505 [Proteobacteria bacterium]|nr:hypothetical protein [Pseudomonadota bacterium]
MNTQKGHGREIAVLLNENARKVGRRVKKAILKAYPKVHLYTSRTLDEAKAKVRELLHKGYERVMCGGGDGTLVSFFSHMKEHMDEWYRRWGEKMKPPRIGILGLGTGNGCASSFGATNWKGVMSRLEDDDYSLTPLHLIESEGMLFPFAGLGWDAAILNNYIETLKRYEGTRWEKWAKSLIGYLHAVFVKTVPRELFRRDPVWCRVMNRGDEVYLASHRRGIQPLPVGRGQTLYEGPMKIIMVGTTEFYGFNLKVLPFSRAKQGLFQLRIGHVSPVSVLIRIGALWRGTIELDGIYDYLVKDVEITLSRPTPYQVGGDAMGYRTQLRFRTSDLVVELMDFRKPLEEREPELIDEAHDMGTVCCVGV